MNTQYQAEHEHGVHLTSNDDIRLIGVYRVKQLDVEDQASNPCISHSD